MISPEPARSAPRSGGGGSRGAERRSLSLAPGGTATRGARTAAALPAACRTALRPAPGAARRDSHCGDRCALPSCAPPRAGTARAALRGSAHAPIPPHARARCLRLRTGTARPRAARVPQPYLPCPALPRTAPTPSRRPAGAPPPRFYWSPGRPRAASAALSGAAPRPSAPPVTARLGSCHNRAGLRPHFLRSRLRSAPPRRADSPPGRPGHGRSAESRPPPRRRALSGEPRDAVPPSPPAPPAAPRRSCRRSAGRWQRLRAAGSVRPAGPLPTPPPAPRRSSPRRRAGGGSAAAAFWSSVPESASPEAAWGRRLSPTPLSWRRPRPPRAGAASSR